MAYVLAPTMSNTLIQLPVDYFAAVGAAATPLGGVMSKLDDVFGCVTLMCMAARLISPPTASSHVAVGSFPVLP